MSMAQCRAPLFMQAESEHERTCSARPYGKDTIFCCEFLRRPFSQDTPHLCLPERMRRRLGNASKGNPRPQEFATIGIFRRHFSCSVKCQHTSGLKCYSKASDPLAAAANKQISLKEPQIMSLLRRHGACSADEMRHVDTSTRQHLTRADGSAG